jgi:hypothetical protein
MAELSNFCGDRLSDEIAYSTGWKLGSRRQVRPVPGVDNRRADHSVTTPSVEHGSGPTSLVAPRFLFHTGGHGGSPAQLRPTDGHLSRRPGSRGDHLGGCRRPAEKQR